jgi:hypothetical protein
MNISIFNKIQHKHQQERAAPSLNSEVLLEEAENK